jgi:hypothetical protein
MAGQASGTQIALSLRAVAANLPHLQARRSVLCGAPQTRTHMIDHIHPSPQGGGAGVLGQGATEDRGENARMVRLSMAEGLVPSSAAAARDRPDQQARVAWTVPPCWHDAAQREATCMRSCGPCTLTPTLPPSSPTPTFTPPFIPPAPPGRVCRRHRGGRPGQEHAGPQGHGQDPAGGWGARNPIGLAWGAGVCVISLFRSRPSTPDQTHHPNPARPPVHGPRAGGDGDQRRRHHPQIHPRGQPGGQGLGRWVPTGASPPRMRVTSLACRHTPNLTQP